MIEALLVLLAMVAVWFIVPAALAAVIILIGNDRNL